MEGSAPGARDGEGDAALPPLTFLPRAAGERRGAAGAGAGLSAHHFVKAGDI